MSYYSDPTASRALGPINREFAKQEKKAKAICQVYMQGKLSEEDFEKAHSQFKGIYKHVLSYALKEALEAVQKKR